MIYVTYPKWTSCRKAKAWLDENNKAYTQKDVKTENPTYEELKNWHKLSGLPLINFFNRNGTLYREMDLKEKLPQMTEDEQLKLLASDGMLVKRPIIIDGNTVLLGFKEAEWDKMK